jgi:hypothetical protein
MLWAVIGFFPCFVKLVFIDFLLSMSIEGMGWILEISDIRLLM